MPSVMKLILTPEQRTLYLNNARFRHGADALEDFIAQYLRGLQATAEEWDKKFARDLAAIRSGQALGTPDGTDFRGPNHKDVG